MTLEEYRQQQGFSDYNALAEYLGYGADAYQRVRRWCLRLNDPSANDIWNIYTKTGQMVTIKDLIKSSSGEGKIAIAKDANMAAKKKPVAKPVKVAAKKKKK